MRPMHAAALLLTLAGAPPAFAADVWTATRTLMPGDVVQAADIVAQTPKRPVLDAVPAERSVVGLEVKRRVYDGRVLTARDVGPRDAVKANTMVDVIWRAGALELAMNGRAMEAGAVGQQIRVLNTDTSRTIRGTVVGDGMVQMTGTMQ